MSSRLLVNIVLLIFIIGLVTLMSTNKDRDIIQQSVTLTNIDPNDIHLIHIKRRELDDIIFQKQNEQWLMQTPFTLPANLSRIQVILKLLEAHSYDHFSAADNDLTPFLLAVPMASILLNDTRIAFGDTNPLEERLRYVLVEDTVHIINDVLFHQLQTSATFFLSSKPLPINATIKKLHLPELLIDNSKPDQLSGEQYQIINAWQQLESVTVRRYKEMEAIDTIKIELDTGESLDLIVLSNRPNLILARPNAGVQYHISGTVSDSLFPGKLEENTTSK